MPSKFLERYRPTRGGLSAKSRRPAGISRRQRKRQLGFETLEDRRVMSAVPFESVLDEQALAVSNTLLDSNTRTEFALASDLSQYTAAELAATNTWVVLTAAGVEGSQLAAEPEIAAAAETGIVPWSYVVDASGTDTQQLIAALSRSTLVDYFYPLVPFEIESLAITNDEFLDRQWHLINFGQNTGNPDFSPIYGEVDEDINIEGAWDTVTGNGVQIGIVDDGLEFDHPDLADNYRADLSTNIVSGGSNPSPSGDDDGHGTAVAGIAAGVGNNGIGITGVAYEADLAGIKLFSSIDGFDLTDADVAEAFVHASDEIDVYNHSWGFVPPVDGQGGIVNPRTIRALDPLATRALRDSVFFGRGGLGGIHVFSAGNSRNIEDSGNYAETVNSRYTIGVTSVIEDGGVTEYAEASAAVLVAAPSGSNPLEIIRDEELGSGIVTTDLQGEAGFNQAPVNGFEIDADYLIDTDYSSRFNGTSASAPIVSGVIALMLEANPRLTYRDVQHILVRSARQNLPTDFSWVTNFQRLFNDPLAFDVVPGDNFFDGAWAFPKPQGTPDNSDPPVGYPTNTQTYYAEPTLPYQFTNGAGFTVSQETVWWESGFAHGVVDATLAVELARNWVSVGPQQSEFTWTTGEVPGLGSQINAAAISDEDSGEFLIPGGLIGAGDPADPNAFIDFFNEFNVDVTIDPEDPQGPFQGDDPPVNTRGFDILLNPDPMSVEWVEVELNITAPAANDFDFLRAVLVSPAGTQSELKGFARPETILEETFHDAGTGPARDPVGNITNDNATLNAVFTTNRHWGERSEQKVRLNTDGTPVRSFDGQQTVDSNPNAGGDPIVDGWKLVFENFGSSVLEVNSYEVAFHGVRETNTGRVQGIVGVDDNGDNVFSDDAGLESNFTRYEEFNLLDGLAGLSKTDQEYADLASLDPYIFRSSLSEDEQESYAAGVIVYADINLNGTRDATDASFQVGHDGNYYFDLVPGTYNIHIDPNSLAAAGLLNQPNLDFANAGPFAVVTITDPGERISGFHVDDGGNTTFFDPFSGQALQTSVPELHALLTPNATPDNIINLSGVVYADLDANGVQDGDDTAIPGANVYIDINQNGIYTPGVDLLSTTDATGAYAFENTPVTPGFYSVAVLEGTTGLFGSPVNPAEGEYSFFLTGGFLNEAVDFGFESGAAGGGPGGGSVAAITGVVFSDVNADGIRNLTDPGLPDTATVYLDLNDNNILDALEPTADPAMNGSYVFNSLSAGQYTVRIEIKPEYELQFKQTTPAGPLNPDGSRIDEDDFEWEVNVVLGEAATGNDFGLHNLAVLDFGDLPDSYRTTAAEDGARHEVFPAFFLGAGVDAELDGPAGAAATGDDLANIDDEDGITFSTLFDNSATITVTATASTDTGFLQAWMDFDADGTFQADEWVITDVPLAEGENEIEVPVPADLTAGGGTVYARFRFGGQGIDSYFGLAPKGEVEDYAIPVISTLAIDPGLQVAQGPDFDGDGRVNGLDFLAWQLGFGITSRARHSDGDANGDGAVNGADLDAWREAYGTTPSPAPLLSTAADTSQPLEASASSVPVAVARDDSLVAAELAAGATLEVPEDQNNLPQPAGGVPEGGETTTAIVAASVPVVAENLVVVTAPVEPVVPLPASSQVELGPQEASQNPPAVLLAQPLALQADSVALAGLWIVEPHQRSSVVPPRLMDERAWLRWDDHRPAEEFSPSVAHADLVGPEVAHRDQALARMFSGQGRAAEDLEAESYESDREPAALREQALARALDEQVPWRLG